LVEKVKGATQTCKCKTELVCVKIFTEWNNKKEEKLQWQNKKDGKAHFKFIGGKPDCFNIISKSETPEESATLQEKPDVNKEPTDELEKFTLEENTIISKISKVVRAELGKVQDSTNPVRGDVVWVRTKEIYNLWRLKND